MNINTANLDTNMEQWASIDGYSNYEVSWWGGVRNAATERILKPGTCTGGYLLVSLCKNGQALSHRVHTLVAREWVLNPKGKRCVDHIDGDRTNNHHVNLRYATHTANNRNSTKTNKARSSIYKGVYLNRPTKKWMAYIRFSGKLKKLGIL